MGKQKIVFLPLDNRPCNYDYPKMLFYNNKKYTFTTIDKSTLKSSKEVSDLNLIKEYLLKETIDASGLVIAFDTLCYGGIVPSRIHKKTLNEIREKLEVIKEIKKNNPNIKIFGFSLVLRCPQCNLDDEEPSYFTECGELLFKSGYYLNKAMDGVITHDENIQFEDIKKILNYQFKDYYEDFIKRRKTNLNVNYSICDLVAEGYVDFLIVPQDDSSHYGYTVIDQNKVKTYVNNQMIYDKVLLYPGADEVGLVLLTRMINTLEDKTPTFYVDYPYKTSKNVIPCLEDRKIDESINAQIKAIKALRVNKLDDAKIVLGFFISADKMYSNPNQYSNQINIDNTKKYSELLIRLKRYYKEGKIIGIVDKTYLNGGDCSLFNLIKEKKMLKRLSSYGAWNTAANSLGTVLSQLSNYYIFKDEEKNQMFTTLRFIDDCIYQSLIRFILRDNYIEKYNVTYFNLGSAEVKNEIVKIATKLLNEEYNKKLSEKAKVYEIDHIDFPWNRLFEIDIKLKKVSK